jgi:N12 class adenine-specific DNA methylase
MLKGKIRQVAATRQSQSLTTANEQSYPAPEEVKPNAYCIVQGDICVREGDSVRVLSDLNSQTRKRIRGLIQVRDAVRRCLRSQLHGHDETEVLAARTELNSVYDSFVARNGPISLRENRRAFREDPDFPLLLSLENFDPETSRATKAAIFRERTIQRARPAQNVSDPKEALLLTLNERGTVDLDHLSALLHRPPTEFLPELKGAVFLNPQTNRWESPMIFCM